jgi:hypothetical protein
MWHIIVDDKLIGFQRGSTRALDAARSTHVSSGLFDSTRHSRVCTGRPAVGPRGMSIQQRTGGHWRRRGANGYGKNTNTAKRCVFGKSGCEMALRRLVVRVGSWCGVCGTGLCPSCPSCCGHTLRGRVRAAAGKVGLASPLPLVSKMRHVILRTGCLSQTLIRSQQILTYPTP